MTRGRLHLLLSVAALGAVACGASANSGTSPRFDGGLARDLAPAHDGAVGAKDGGKSDTAAPNVYADAPVFNWDGGSSPGSGGSAAGSGGNGGGGGSTGRGGSTGSGGQRFDAAMADAPLAIDTAMDASVRPDARPDMLAADAATPIDLGVPRDAVVAPDAAPDLAPPDAQPGCLARIVPVIPALLADNQSLVAAENIRVVLRAQVVAGTPAAPSVSWGWSGKWNGSTAIGADADPKDSSVAAFLIAKEGDYVFTAVAGNCGATFARSARGPGGCSACDYGSDVQVVPPPSYGLPSQSGYFGYAQGISLAESHTVKFFPSVGNVHIPAYVRINSPDGVLLSDGYADPSIGFSRPLLMLASNGDMARYQVLVVPLDGSGDGTSGATAPQRFDGKTTLDLGQGASLGLSGGLRISGTVLGPDGRGQGDVRIMLSNQDPAADHPPADLIFSSVGRSDAQGSFDLRVQPGQYWVSLFPSAESGLSDVIDPSPITVAHDATLAFQWNATRLVPLTLNVRDATGRIAANTRVLLGARELPPVGTLTFQSGADVPVAHPARADLEVEASTDAANGAVTFAGLPADATFDVRLVPAVLEPAAATTETAITASASAPDQTVVLAAQQYIFGKLQSGIVGATPDWTLVQVIGFDKSSVAAEAPRAVVVSKDGTFALGVSPGRPYAVVAWPDPSTGLARTFVGPGLMQASNFLFTQKVQAAMSWTSTVMISRNNQTVGIEGATLQVTCHPGYWRCIDPTIPLAETGSTANGAFTLAVPDPATR